MNAVMAFLKETMHSPNVEWLRKEWNLDTLMFLGFSRTYPLNTIYGISNAVSSNEDAFSQWNVTTWDCGRSDDLQLPNDPKKEDYSTQFRIWKQKILISVETPRGMLQLRKMRCPSKSEIDMNNHTSLLLWKFSAFHMLLRNSCDRKTLQRGQPRQTNDCFAYQSVRPNHCSLSQISVRLKF